MICRRYIISGRVQGVFFRAGTRDVATDIGLLGWVKNRHDGDVEALALGDDEQLTRFENWLKIGTELSKVSNIKVVAEDSERALREVKDCFEIKATS